MPLGHAVVSAVLRSPAHPLVSRWVCLVRYTGPRSGRVVTLPVLYARHGDDVVVVVGWPAKKRWWRAFRNEHDIDLLVRGRWEHRRARVVSGADEPEVAAPLFATYEARFPRSTRSLPGDTVAERRRAALVVRCRPR
jgi:hypothetical protein